MSEGKKKVIHRLEPKKRPIVLSKISDKEKQAEVSELPMTVNAQFFQDFVDDQVTLESHWGEGNKKSTGRKWMFRALSMMGGFFIFCAVWAVFLLNQPTQIDEIHQSDSVDVSFEKKQELRRQTIIRYLAAQSVAEKALYVRDAERVLPLMKKYYAKHALVAETPLDDVIEHTVMGKEKVLWRVKVREKGPHRPLSILVETDEKGVSRIDWETDVVYQMSDWKAFRRERSADPHAFRARVQVAQLDGFHGFEFADYDKYRCFRVSLPGRDNHLWGYTEIGSVEDFRLMKLITVGGKYNLNNKRNIPVMLELRYPEKSKSGRCVHITKLIQSGWLN